MTWQPIETAPKDGTEILLWFPYEKRGTAGIDGGAIQGWWFSSPKQIDDGWETIIGFVGEPNMWQPFEEPEQN